MPERWTIRYGGLTFNIKPMNFKHTGLFPEQAANWDFAQEQIRRAGRPIRVLNLFAYTGGATVACAAAGASVCHVDAARGMVSWARENARSSGPVSYTHLALPGGGHLGGCQAHSSDPVPGGAGVPIPGVPAL